MSSSATPSERDLRTLAGIVSDHRSDFPKDGLPLSLLAELMGQIRCDLIAFHGYDSGRQQTLFLQPGYRAAVPAAPCADVPWVGPDHPAPACYRLARGIRPLRGPRPAFQVSGRSLSDVLERSMITYREVVMAAISARGAGVDE